MGTTYGRRAFSCHPVVAEKRGCYSKMWATSTTSLPSTMHSPTVTSVYRHKVVFSSCDAFNQRKHGRTFPYRLLKDTNLAERRNFGIIPFLHRLSKRGTFGVIWNSRDTECDLADFRQFCHSLCLDIVDKLCF